MTNEEQGLFEKELSQFVGTETWYKIPLADLYYTDGIKHLVDRAACWWLVTDIAAYQMVPKVKAEEFQTWILTVEKEKGTLRCEDGNENVVFKRSVGYTTFPLPEIKLFLTDEVLMLPSEY